MATISLCMIVRDEEETLERCLQSVADVVDEIVIVDTGSVDGTKQIAGRFTDKVYDFHWRDDFAVARNFAFSKGTGEYLLWLDADDILPKEEKEKLLQWKKELSESPCDVVMMLYDVAFDEAGKATFSYYRERLLRRCPRAKWEGRVHEVITPFGEVRYAEIHIQHKKERKGYSERNLRIYEKMLAEGMALDPREQFYYARELYYHGRYEKAVKAFSGFLAESQGWLENKLEACRYLAYCHFALKRQAEGLQAYLQGLTLAPPGGELCCDIGKYFFERKEWKQAIFWYENALRAEKRTQSGAFVQEECYGYLPSIQLCVCYDRLGDKKRAKAYNEMAGVFKPHDEAVEKNRVYFSKG